MENTERAGAAVDVAKWFGGDDAPQASAHYLVDDQAVVQGVREQDVAWAAPGANANGIHIEHAGRASQGAEQWLDQYSSAMLELSAMLAADICYRYRIPVVALNPDELKDGLPGITTHANVSLAFRKSDHTDPGPGFPMSYYLGRVEVHLRVVERYRQVAFEDFR